MRPSLVLSAVCIAVCTLTAHAAPLRVCVTGAGGRTGVLCFKKLSERSSLFAPPIGLVKSDKAAKTLRNAGAKDLQVVRSDVRTSAAIVSALAGKPIDALVICTSAVPKIKKLSILKLLLGKLLRRKGGRPEFKFPRFGTPEEVDYYGLLAQIEAAKQLNIPRVVLVSSMGGTDKDNFLNTIGVKTDGTGGQILMWKRKGENALVESGLDYTIIHPGGLLDESGGKRRLVLGVDDELLKREVRNIPREDVAEVCVQSLLCDGARMRAFDIIADPAGEGEATTDFEGLFASETRSYDYGKDPGEPMAALPYGIDI